MIEAEKVVGDAEPQFDRATALLEKWQVKMGDLWRIGAHRLLCGDSTKREDVERVMQGEKAQLFFTDPPYGMDKGFANDELKDGDLTSFNDKWVEQFIGEDDCIFVSFHSPRLFWTILDSARNNGWKVGRYFSLYKPNDMTFPWHSWLGVSESILLFMRGKPKFNSDKPADTSFWHDTYLWNHQGLVADETKSNGQTLSHPSIKPIPVCEDLIWKTSFPGWVVYDPFGGSGTTMVACNNLGRKCRMMELEPKYCSVILERMSQAFPGIEIKRVE